MSAPSESSRGVSVKTQRVSRRASMGRISAKKSNGTASQSGPLAVAGVTSGSYPSFSSRRS